MTSSLKIRGGVVFAVVVAVVAALAAWWLTPRSGPSVNAQEAFETACEKTSSALSYNMAITWEMPAYYGSLYNEGREVAEVKVSVSGEDYHQSVEIRQIPNEGNQPFSEESIYVDGVGYFRSYEGQVESEWRIADKSELIPPDAWLADRALGTSDKLSGDNPLCPVLENVTRAGEETIGGVQTTRFAWSETIDLLEDNPSETMKVQVSWEFWIDAGDKVVQTRMVAIHPREQHLRGQTPSGMERMELVNRISGVGEPTTITVPVVSGQ